MTFQQSLPFILAREGGYVNDPDDAGGETYKGISRVSNPNWIGWKRIDFFKTSQNFPAVLDTDDELSTAISDLYFSNYWLKIKADTINNGLLQLHMFDVAVNSGPIASIIMLQQAIGCKDDGLFGNKTLAALNNTQNQKQFVERYVELRREKYALIVKKRPTQLKYLKGWLNRIFEVEKYFNSLNA
jgi:lysozyme family protein